MTSKPDDSETPEETVTVVLRDHSNAWPPKPNETAEMSAIAADHWDERLWRRGAF
ncbi:UNVERIFIED_ORG: hypothetical protein FNL38_1011029 [Nocardia globerula]|uniref:Uncharacterized protein n=1 Tax=Nocardia globerula TaxID=1818 RepID=A0A652YYA4_NOCGL|nr:hypothetical protein [Rhodococcus globerulus]NMD58972.1 hypothetical protein [Nocardia globerula]PVX64963.1 hypothetical protein C8E04_2249 [Rhodococcus globerulus]